MSSFTVFFDGTFWVGVVRVREPDGTVRAARHVFGAEPGAAELWDFVRHEGGRLIDRALASPAVPPAAGDGDAVRGTSARRAAREAAREQRRPGETAARAALSAATESAAADRRESARERRARDAERRREVLAAKRKARHRGR